MKQYENDDLTDHQQSQTKPMTHQQTVLNKHGQVKKAFDFMASTPGKIRRGVARHGDQLRGFTEYNMKLSKQPFYQTAMF